MIFESADNYKGEYFFQDDKLNIGFGYGFGDGYGEGHLDGHGSGLGEGYGEGCLDGCGNGYGHYDYYGKHVSGEYGEDHIY